MHVADKIYGITYAPLDGGNFQDLTIEKTWSQHSDGGGDLQAVKNIVKILLMAPSGSQLHIRQKTTSGFVDKEAIVN